MPCDVITDIDGEPMGFICRPTTIDSGIRMIDCPVCRRREAFNVKCYEWYGPSVTCLCCGTAWNDGERSVGSTDWREKYRNVARIIREMEVSQ